MSIESIAERAVELREKGLSTREICQELHLGRSTVEWLLARQASEPGDRPPADVKVGWRSIGVSGLRMRAIAEIMADIILEEQAQQSRPLLRSWVSAPTQVVPFADRLRLTV